MAYKWKSKCCTFQPSFKNWNISKLCPSSFLVFWMVFICPIHSVKPPDTYQTAVQCPAHGSEQSVSLLYKLLNSWGRKMRHKHSSLNYLMEMEVRVYQILWKFRRNYFRLRTSLRWERQRQSLGHERSSEWDGMGLGTRWMTKAALPMLPTH